MDNKDIQEEKMNNEDNAVDNDTIADDNTTTDNDVTVDSDTLDEEVVVEANCNDDEDNNEEEMDKSVKKKKEKKDKKDELIDELTDKYKRTFAEFDNFRKRSEKEKSSMYEYGAKSIVEKILPIVDNFERGFKSVNEEDMKTPFAVGMDLVYKQMLKALEDMDVKPIDAVGKEFDPNLHNAVMHVEDESLGENVVAEELQKGYMYKDSVVRHSMVKVAN